MRKAKHCEPNGWCRPWQVGRSELRVLGYGPETNELRVEPT